MTVTMTLLVTLRTDLLGTKEMTMKFLVDNMSAIALSKNSVYHDQSKHIHTEYQFIHECIEEGKVEIDHVSTAGQLADILTKPLGRVKFTELREALGIIKVQ